MFLLYLTVKVCDDNFFYDACILIPFQTPMCVHFIKSCYFWNIRRHGVIETNDQIIYRILDT